MAGENPLVAQAPAEPDGLFNAGTGDNGWATGISLAESAMDTYKGFAEGNWIEAGLGTVGLVADAASLAVDPFGTLLSSAASFLMEHMQPLKQMLDWLAGNPPVIDSYSQTWNNVAQELKAVAEDYASAVRTGTEGWTGPAAEAYRRSAAEHGDALSGAASAAGAVGTVVGLMGMVVAFVREFVRDLIADLVGKLIAWVLEAVFSLGFGTPVIVAQAITAISKWGARIAEIVQKLLNTIKKVSPMIARLVEVFEKIAKVVGKIAGKVTGLDVLHPSSVIPGGFVRRGGGGGADLPGGSAPGGRGDGPDGSDAPGSPDSPATPGGPGADTPGSSRPTTNTPAADTPGATAPRTDTSTADAPGASPRGTTPEPGAPSRATQPDGGPTPSSRPAADTTTSSHAPVDTPTSSPRRDVGDPMPGAPRAGRDPDLPAGNPPSGAPAHPNTPTGGGPTPRTDTPSPAPRGQTTASSSTPDAPPRPTHPAAPQHTQPSQPQIPTQPTHAGGTPSSSAGTPNTTASGAPRQGGQGWTGTPGHRGDLNSGAPTTRTPDPTRPSNHTPGHTGTSTATPPPHTPAAPPHGTPGTPHSPNHGTTPSANTPNHSTTPSGTRPTAPPPDGARPRAADPWTPPRQDAPHRTPDAGRPDPSRPDAGRPDAPHPAQNRPDAHHPDSNRPDAPDYGVHPHHDTPTIDQAHAHHGETTPSGVSHHRGDPNMGDLPHRVLPDPRYFTADVHITPDGRARIGNHTYTPEQYGDLLRRTGWDGRTPIRLIGCDAGSNTFADRLSRHTNADVLAPTKPAWTDNAGRVYTSDAEVGPDGTRRPRIPPNGEWNTHRPDGTTTRAGDDGYVPGTRDTDRADHAGPDNARDRAALPGDRAVPTHQDIDWQEPQHTRTDSRTVPSGQPFYHPPAHTPDLEPRTRYEITDSDGRRTTVYTDDSTPPRVTHVDAHTDNTRTGHPGGPISNPDASHTLPDVEYRVHTDGEPFTFRTDDTGRPRFDLDNFGLPDDPKYLPGGSNYRRVDGWDATSSSFSNRADLEPDHRYEVHRTTPEGARLHGVFHTSPEVTPDGRSQFTHIETWTDQNPELGNRDTMRRYVPALDSNGDPILDANNQPVLRESAGLPLAETRYQVGDRVFHSDAIGNAAVSFEPHYGDPHKVSRDDVVQRRVGHYGNVDHGGQWRGGHTQDHVSSSVNEAVGLHTQAYRQNNLLRPTTDPLSTYKDSWRQMEIDRKAAHDSGERIERVRVWASEASEGRTPDRHYVVEQRLDKATNQPVVHYRSFQNVSTGTPSAASTTGGTP
ncbi:hypothetical protein Amir_2580 [Actinosynnema mirum DSM 43827]|uniref:PPE domain-containing protein n=1 Tax=Actinosynnema mirum (strain ATCC 29888 / DSM 43827 / JCM 3225 / NBRC 14064 / NCIMB 13271 / NRRL B-12336 / IMRU 3971 / 101) TaxID=446462 RepID=C6WMI8_ACTMD|nr:hypothetical protein Amir_2580 [Actinosynnema mirum DSM 43827]